MVERAKFRRMVRPGDKLELEAAALARAARTAARCRRRRASTGSWRAEAELTFAFAEVKNPKLIARRREVLNVWLTGSTEEP